MSRTGRVVRSLPVVSHIKRRIHKVNIFLIQLFTKQLNRFAKSLEVNDFTFPQEFNHIIDIRIVAEPKNVIIGRAGLLFWERIA